MPDYAPMTRRPVVDNGWYDALTRDNVELVTDKHPRASPPTGIETDDGTVRDVDYVITATGFDVIKFLWPADYVGIDGAHLHERWSNDGPRAYLSMMVPGLPQPVHALRARTRSRSRAARRCRRGTRSGRATSRSA